MRNVYQAVLLGMRLTGTLIGELVDASERSQVCHPRQRAKLERHRGSRVIEILMGPQTSRLAKSDRIWQINRLGDPVP